MGLSLLEVAFYVISVVIIVFSILSVTTSRIMRAATYLLLVLMGTGVIYGLLGYTYLSAVQIIVYAGGIIVLYIFSVLLTRSSSSIKYPIKKAKLISVLLTCIVGTALVIFIILNNHFIMSTFVQGEELPMKVIGHTMIGSEKYQYVLPFEAVSFLLLACMIGAIMIARKKK